MRLSSSSTGADGGGGRGSGDHNAYSGNPTTVATNANGPISTHHKKSNQDEEREFNGSGGRKAAAAVVPGLDDSAAVSVVSEGPAEVGLRGVAFAPDTRGHARKRLSQGVERGVLAAKVEEIVREVVRGVRTPVREEEVTKSIYSRVPYSHVVGHAQIESGVEPGFRIRPYRTVPYCDSFVFWCRGGTLYVCFLFFFQGTIAPS